MGSNRNKLGKFAFNKACPIVLEWGKEEFENIKGNWHKEFFKNDNPIIYYSALDKQGFDSDEIIFKNQIEELKEDIQILLNE